MPTPLIRRRRMGRANRSASRRRPLVAAGLLAMAAAAAEPPTQVLMIGNSYTAGVYPVLTQMVRDAAAPLDIVFPHPDINLVGLNRFANYARDPRVTSLLETGRWDVVVLQDQSQLPAFWSRANDGRVAADPAGSWAGGRALAARVLSNAGGRLVFFSSWARLDESLQTFGGSASNMQRHTDRFFDELASVLGPRARVARIGDAFLEAERRQPGLRLRAADGSHPSPAGAYLAACVFFEVLAGRPPPGSGAAAGKAGPDAALLRTCARAGSAWRPTGGPLAGADLSSLPVMEQYGAVYCDEDGEAVDAPAFLRARGFNAARVRLFVKPDGKDLVVNDGPYTLRLVQRLKAAGLRVLLDFHCSDTWADPGKQGKPADWRNLAPGDLERQLEKHIADTVANLIRVGLAPDLVQVGNEIENGILWPDGQVIPPGGGGPRWDELARLLQAGIRGVRTAAQDFKAIPVMLHVSCGGDAARTRQFFEAMEARGVRFDVIGLSYYPWWHGPLRNFEANLAATSARFGKPVIVVETAYPFRDAPSWQREKNMDWPISPEGQERFLDDVCNAVRRTPGGAGVFYWFPESVPVRGLHGWYRGSAALWDAPGRALPGLRRLGTAAAP